MSSAGTSGSAGAGAGAGAAGGGAIDMDVACRAMQVFVGMEFARRPGAASAGTGSGAGAGVGAGAGAAAVDDDAHANSAYVTVAGFLADYPLGSLFAMLAMPTLTEKQLKLVCSAIHRVMMAPEAAEFLNSDTTRAYLIAGLKHPHPSVRRLTTAVMKARFVGSANAPRSTLLLEESVVNALVEALKDADTKVADTGVTCITEVAKLAPAAFVPKIVTAVAELTASSLNSTAEVRVMDATARLSGVSDAALGLVADAGLLVKFEEVFASDDILMQLNAVELLAPIASTLAGAARMINGGIVTKLLFLGGVADEEASKDDEAPAPDAFIGAQALAATCQIVKNASQAGRLPAAVAARRDSIIRRVFDAIHRYLAVSDEKWNMAAMRALVDLCWSGSAGLRVLLQRPRLIHEWLEFGQVNSMPLRVACLHSLARALEAATGAEAALAASSMPREGEDGAGGGSSAGAGASAGGVPPAQQLFEALGTSCGSTTMAVLMGAIQEPFAEVRIAVFDVQQAAVAHPAGWGVRAVVGHAGVTEFLLNPATEPSKECVLKKHEVLEGIVRCPAAPTILGTALGSRLGKAVLGGPYRVDERGKKAVKHEVATQAS